ncbi:MAG: 16S rRNA (cytosine(1402)-N(4))-methyltransferase RsmH [Synergistaceae bacterium]|nr:16S rRNA (cytosine(1402)-N(4))-methyltransferase RsmH [Synergistaceae bacterium]
MMQHEPVMLNEVSDLIENYPHSKILDCTLGLGGYSKEFLNRFPESKVTGIDRDTQAINFSRQRLESFGSRFTAVHGNFSEIAKLTEADSFDVFVFDLGVSNMQLTLPERGFSFGTDGPLDMRMNPDDDSLPTAAEILRDLSADELSRVFSVYGEERYAKVIASAIKRRRSPVTTTTELVDLIRETLPKPVQRKMGTHPARRIFQALRIYVNNETGELESLLKTLPIVNQNSLVIFVSYHSIEDRLVKHSFRQWQADGKGKILTRHPLVPSENEIERNYKARSAKLRAFFLNMD